MNGVMKQPIPHTRFMDVSRLRIVDLECLICRMLISLILQITVKCDDAGHEVPTELLYIFSLALTTNKFLPSRKNIFERNDIMIAMFKLDPSQTMKAPPQPDFAGLE